MDISVSASRDAAQGRIRAATYRPEIDSLRALAVIAVMLSHWVPSFPRPLNWGLAGVFVFFVISGYVITRGLLKEKAAGGINIPAFYWRRAVRIWPVYYLSIAFIYFVWPGFTSGGVLWHVFFLSSILSSIKGQFLFPIHFWSLSVEELFYLFWPLLMLLPDRHLGKICIAMLVVSPLSRWYFADQLHNFPASYFAPTGNLDCLAAGAMLAMAEHRGKAIPNWIGIAGVLMLASLAFASRAGLHTAGDWPMATSFAAISAWLICWLGRTPSAAAITCIPALQYIGKISYGIYIYHLLVGDYILRTMVGKQSPWVFAIVSMAATVAIASVSWLLIEKPLLALKRIRSTTM